LTWWGYLDWAKPRLRKIGKQCRAKISFDDYYSNSEFLQRMQSPQNNYDVIIYSDTISKFLDNKIGLKKSQLYKLSEKYIPTVKKNYLLNKFPHNVLYFEHGLTAFVYNPKLIKFLPKDDLYDFFRKAGNNIVVLLNDPTETNMLLSMALNKNKYDISSNKNLISLDYNHFIRLAQNAHIIVTNSPQRILKLPNFAFAFQWSGDAISMVEANPNLKLFVDPRVSYITSDLIAELNTKRATNCVAKKLAGKSFLMAEENHTFYFSPYGGYSGSKNKLYRKLYEKISKQLPLLPWISPLPPKKLKQITQTWKFIKLKLAKKNY
jgi:hypothetical protein